MNLNWPGLSTDAWDVAVANQSAGWIDPVKLQRYSAAYAALRQMDSWIQHDSALLFNGPRMIELSTDLRLGTDVSPKELLYTVSQIRTTISSMQNQLHELDNRLRKALPETDGQSAKRQTLIACHESHRPESRLAPDQWMQATSKAP